MSLALALLQLFLAGGAPAHAQGMDLVDQRIAVDLSHDAMHVEIDLDLVATEDATTFAILDPFVPITSLEADGVALELEPDRDYPGIASWLTWPDALEAGDEVHLRLVLDGEPDCDPGFSQGVVCILEDDEKVLFPSSPGGAWSFVNLFDSDAYTATFTVTAPADHAVAAGQGAPTSIVDEPDGARTWTFDADIPVESVAVWARVAEELRSNDGRVAGWVDAAPASAAAMQPMVDLAALVWPLYEEMYLPLGLDEVHLLTFSELTPFGGMGLLGNVLLYEFVLDDHFSYIREQGVAHELAHSWWGNFASAGPWEQRAFFNEAVAEYSGWRALGALQGDDARTAGARMNAVWYMLRRPGDQDLAVFDPAATESEVYVFVTYHKGSVILRTLEEAAGPDLFAEALRAFVARGVGGLSAEALVDDVRAAGGPDLSDTVDQWLREPGYPRLVVASTETAEGVRLDVTATEPHRFGLPVRVELEDGATVEETIAIEPGETSHTIALETRPVRIQIDPRWTLVRHVTPALDGDVTLDGRVDAADLIEVALHAGAVLPTERRVDGGYDPLHDVDGDERVDRSDLEWIAAL